MTKTEMVPNFAVGLMLSFLLLGTYAQGQAKVTMFKYDDSYSFPVVEVKDPAISARINRFLLDAEFTDKPDGATLKTAFEQEKQAKREAFGYGWLDSKTYTVDINEPSLLAITVTSRRFSKVDALSVTQYNFDPRTGYNITLEQIISPSRMLDLRGKVRKEFDGRIRASLKKADDEKQEIVDRQEILNASIPLPELSKFSLSSKGITLFSNSSDVFPHYQENYDPSPEYFYSWESIKAFLLKDSPISTLVGQK